MERIFPSSKYLDVLIKTPNVKDEIENLIQLGRYYQSALKLKFTKV